MKLALSLPLAAVLLVLSLPGIASTECIASSVNCSGEIAAPTTPTFNTSCDNPIMSVAWLDYDVPARRMNFSYSESMNIALSLRDQFQVTGPTPGTPVPMRVRLRFSGTACGYGLRVQGRRVRCRSGSSSRSPAKAQRPSRMTCRTR
jgi:hypothetical protein